MHKFLTDSILVYIIFSEYTLYIQRYLYIRSSAIAAS